MFFKTGVSDLFEFFSPGVLNATVCISIKNRYVYFEVPKAACSTIKNALHQLETDGLAARPRVTAHPLPVESPFVKPYQLKREDLLHILRSPEFFRFSFVRDPYSRLLSAYRDKILNDDEKTRRYFRNSIGAGVDDDISFTSFVGRVSRQSHKAMDKHWTPQIYQSFAHFCDLDFVGKLENFKADFGTVLMRINANVDAPTVAPHATGSAAKMREYYTSEAAARVAQIFARDFECFEYDRDPDWLNGL